LCILYTRCALGNVESVTWRLWQGMIDSLLTTATVAMTLER